MRTIMSYLAGTLVPNAADGSDVVNAGTTSSYQGLTRAFNRMVIRFGGVVVEDISSYSDVLAMYYSTLPETRRKVLKALEGFGDTGAWKNGKRKWAHALMSSLFVTDQSLPLPLIQSGGITIELFWAPASELFTSANVAYYEIQQPSFRWMGITPDPSYTIALRSAVAAGRSAFIHFQKLHFYPSNGNGSQTLQIQVPIGQVSSIASVDTVFWDETSYADRTKDKYLRFHSANLVDFKIENNGTSQPSQLSFKYEGGADPKVVLLGLISSSGSIYTMDRDVSLQDNFETSSFRIGMNFQSSNENAGTGLSTLGSSSPFLTITTTHSAVVPPTTRILTVATVDALIEFRGAEIAISEIF
ncbi:hypothetical protein HK097_004083 [Rhizophlyctis rosea]|uniref:Uncharacterized protein n=1 Tax=Rhizophlyctis rosea TaxID=64517 RepID=A0AAD5SG74_9FUNG|nr:hypothetical protein HK097_004083 [Rhizophlyctis rosea]